ncbi:MAG TPA: DinB family protein [Gemmatimonadaceae bacterium]|nr:DinB family protein [Gemmatimonadaceae bacterium]
MTATATPSETRSTRPAPDEYAPYYGRYIEKVPDGDVVRTLREHRETTSAFLRGIPDAKGGHRYAPDKWSIREVVGHLSDCERIFAYRALRFARADETLLPGFDENEFVKRARLDERPMTSLIAELEAVRGATVALFDGLFPDEWSRVGNANGKAMSVRALAWTIAGHELHHLGILRERYL